MIILVLAVRKRGLVPEEVPLDKDLKNGAGDGLGRQGQRNVEPCDWKQGGRCLACGCLDQQAVSAAEAPGERR